MGITRLLCFLSLSARLETKLMLGCLAFAAGFFVLGHGGFLWGFCLAGVLGPFFPLLLARISRVFPEVAAKLTIWVLTVVQGTLAVLHLTVGWLTDRWGITHAYQLPAFFLLLALGTVAIYLWAEAAGAKRQDLTFAGKALRCNLRDHVFP
jgi:hypothetical protein